MREREEKAQALAAKGQNPYANDFFPDATAEQIHATYASASRDDLAARKAIHHVAGRVMAVRDMGKAAFLRIQDRTRDLQIFVQLNRVGEQGFETLKLIDVGDFIGVSGSPMRTKTEELSIAADSLRVLTKSLRPLPE